MRQNRAFFFAAYQGKVEKTEPSTAQRFVPSAAMRAGDFTAFASPACNNGRQVALRAPFVGNRVDPAAFSPAAMKLLNFVPVTDDPCGPTNSESRTTTPNIRCLTSGLQAQRWPLSVRAVPVCRL